MANLIGCRNGIAGDQPFAAGKPGKPAELQGLAVFVIQLLD
jgi:hypothetical protein